MRQMDGSPEEAEEGKDKPHDETEQVESFPGHLFLLPARRATAASPDSFFSGRRTWRSRSARCGVSRISPKRIRHSRESGCLATERRALLTSGFRRNRSAP